MSRSKYDVPAADECPECEGRGYPPDTAQVMRVVDGVPVTTSLGFGCINCQGLGRLALASPVY